MNKLPEGLPPPPEGYAYDKFRKVKYNELYFINHDWTIWKLPNPSNVLYAVAVQVDESYAGEGWEFCNLSDAEEGRHKCHPNHVYSAWESLGENNKNYEPTLIYQFRKRKKQKNKSNTWFMCLNPYPEANKPIIRHNTFEEAHREAERLCIQTGKKIHVLQKVGSFLPSKPKWTNLKYIKEEDMQSYITLRESEPEVYSGEEFKMKREYGLTPNGNHMNGKWVLRKNGEIIDYDKYRNDVAERNNLILENNEII